MNFEGTYVAMVTPFTDDGNIDEEGFRSNINYLIDKGVTGLLGAGTSGESATLTHEEHRKVVEILIDEVGGRVETVAGSGSNSTHEAIELTKSAEELGADAALVITPYYNKPQQHALIKHYQAISDATDIPIIAYNVPSRTGVDMSVETIVELAKIDGVDAVKEASGSVNKVSELYKALTKEGLEEDFNILSGEDYTRAQELHYEMIDVIDALFIESNPVPAKTAMNIMGLPAGPLRAPLTDMKDENVEILKNALKEADLI